MYYISDGDNLDWDFSCWWRFYCLHASQLRGKFWLSFDPADSNSWTDDLGEGAVTDGVSVEAGARKCSVYIDESWR